MEPGKRGEGRGEGRGEAEREGAAGGGFWWWGRGPTDKQILDHRLVWLRIFLGNGSCFRKEDISIVFLFFWLS